MCVHVCLVGSFSVLNTTICYNDFANTFSAVAPASLPVVALPRLRFAQLDACSTEREGEREREERELCMCGVRVCLIGSFAVLNASY